MKHIRKMFGLFLGLLIVVGCGTKQESPAAPAAAMPPAAVAQAPATQTSAQAVLDVTVNMLDYSYEPNVITVPVGAQVRLTIVNAGQRSHDLNIIGGPSVEGDIRQPGQSQVLEFTAAQAGQFQIVCSQRGHKDKGMVASLIVQ